VLLGSFTTIAAGSSFTGGITNTGALFMWGVGALGVLGNSATINRSSPIQIGTSSWTAIAAGASVASAIRSDGSIFNWGAGTLGQLGQAYSIISRSSPIQLGNEYAVANVYIPTKIDGELGTTSWSSVSAGNSYSAGISNNNSLFLWGLNNAGQIGLNDTINRSSPTQVTGTYSEVSAGNSFTGARAIIYPTSQ
jgi:alpha-tubulin suppressor-like RCC1 family protein